MVLSFGSLEFSSSRAVALIIYVVSGILVLAFSPDQTQAWFFVSTSNSDMLLLFTTLMAVGF